MDFGTSTMVVASKTAVHAALGAKSAHLGHTAISAKSAHLGHGAASAKTGTMDFNGHYNGGDWNAGGTYHANNGFEVNGQFNHYHDNQLHPPSSGHHHHHSHHHGHHHSHHHSHHPGLGSHHSYGVDAKYPFFGDKGNIHGGIHMGPGHSTNYDVGIQFRPFG